MSNTNIPPFAPNPDIRQQRLARAAELRARRQENRERIRGNTLLNSNNLSLIRLNQSIIRYGNAVDNLRVGFKQADNLQVKSLATGTTMSKFLKENNEVLSNLRGDYFENANEILKNFTAGIRDNNTDINELTNRMHITGQDTNSMRLALVDMLEVTGNNIDAAGRLARNTDILSKNFLLGSDKLLQAVNGIKDLMQKTSLTGGGEGTAQALQAGLVLTGGKNDDDLRRILNLFVSPDFFSTRFALGIQDAEDTFLKSNIPLQQTMESFKMFTERAFNNANNVIGTGFEANNNTMKSLRAAFVGADNVGALKRIYEAMQNQTSISSDMRATQEELYENQRTIESESLNYFKKFNTDLYPLLMKALPAITLASVVSNGAALGRGVAGMAGRMGMGSLSFLGPVGIAAALGYTFWPEITGFLGMGASEAKKQTKIQKEISFNTQKSSDKSESKQSTLLGSVLEQFLRDARDDSRKFNLQTTEQKTTNILLKELVDYSKSGNGAPSKIARSFR
jgi:hypothetical protein